MARKLATIFPNPAAPAVPPSFGLSPPDGKTEFTPALNMRPRIAENH